MKKLHITLSDESFEAVRKLAYDVRTSLSAVIDVVIEENLVCPRHEEHVATANGER